MFCRKLLTLRVFGQSESRRLHFLTALFKRLTVACFLSCPWNVPSADLTGCSSIDVTSTPFCPFPRTRASERSKTAYPIWTRLYWLLSTRVRMTRGTRVNEIQIDSLCLHKRKNARSERNLTKHSDCLINVHRTVPNARAPLRADHSIKGWGLATSSAGSSSRECVELGGVRPYTCLLT